MKVHIDGGDDADRQTIAQSWREAPLLQRRQCALIEALPQTLHHLKNFKVPISLNLYLDTDRAFNAL